MATSCSPRLWPFALPPQRNRELQISYPSIEIQCTGYQRHTLSDKGILNMHIYLNDDFTQSTSPLPCLSS